MSNVNRATTFPLWGHRIHVEPAGDAWAFRVVRECDEHVVVADLANTEPEALETAVAHVDRPQAHHWDHPIPSICFDDYPGAPQMLLHRVEGITRAAYGVAAIGDVLFRHNLESDETDGTDGTDARPLRMRTVEGLTRALGVLAEYVEDAAHQAARDASSKR